MLIKKKYDGKPTTAEKAACALFPELGYAAVMKCFRKKDVKVNGARVGKSDTVREGDEVAVYAAEASLKKVDIVYSDERIAVVNKPQGMASVGADSAETALSKQLGKTVYPVHRLDTNTAGLIIFALDTAAEERLVKAFKEREIEKKYLVKVFGVPKKEEGVFEDWFRKDAASGLVEVSAKQGAGVPAVTAYKTLSTFEGTSVLEVTLITGRTHQIRASMAFHGLPVVGDGKYGDFYKNKKFNRKRQCLVSCYIKFNIPNDDKELGYLNGKVIKLEAREAKKVLGEF